MHNRSQLESAFQSHQSGDLAAAEIAYRKLTAETPDYVDAWQLLGALLIQTRRYEEATVCLKQAIAHAPSSSGYWSNLGIAYSRLDKVDEAIGAYHRAIQLDPSNFESLKNLSTLFLKAKRYAEAIPLLEKATRLAPQIPDLALNLGTALHRCGREVEARQYYARQLELDPNNKRALIGLGQILLKAKKPEPLAAECWQKLTAMEPGNVAYFNNLATTLKNMERFPEAESACRRALEIQPGYFPALCNLGLVLSAESRMEEAREVLREATESVEGGKEGIRFDKYPELTEQNLTEFLSVALNQLAAVTNVLGDEEEAQRAVGQGLKLAPDNSDHQMMQGFLYLQRGEFEKGWPHYEYRKKNELGPRSFPKPEWKGEKALDQTLLIHAEQGLGDTIHFIRYAKLAKQFFSRVVFLSHRPLAKLMKLVPYIDDVIPDGDPLPHFDKHIALLSLPHTFQTTFETVPREVPYLFADPNLIAKWKAKLNTIDGFKIGIAWQGNKDFANDKFRRVPLKQFECIAKLPGVRLVCLQKGDGTEQLSDINFEVIQLDDVDTSAGAFMDTAAIMSDLDLIISPCTATPHLAGALARPIWLAKSFAAEWRWMSDDREENQWYPTMRMFRQPAMGEWGPVFAKMTRELKSLIQ